MNKPLEVPYDEKDRKHTYVQEERDLIVKTITERVFEPRKLFVMLIFDPDNAPEVLTNTTKPWAHEAMEYVMRHHKEFWDDDTGNQTVLAKNVGRRH